MKKALLLFGLLTALTIPSGLWARQAGYSQSNLVSNVTGVATTRSVDNHILRLREKLERDFAQPVHFRTVHGVGYQFVR
jgi:DNA-binding response OmpR family regulator